MNVNGSHYQTNAPGGNATSKNNRKGKGYDDFDDLADNSIDIKSEAGASNDTSGLDGKRPHAIMNLRRMASESSSE